MAPWTCPGPNLWARSPRPTASEQQVFRLLSHGENNSKARFAAHHALVCFVDAFERKGFVHRADAGAGTEGERILGVDRGSGIPAFHGAAATDRKSVV